MEKNSKKSSPVKFLQAAPGKASEPGCFDQ
ncbi:hypothetical protein J2S01_000941 [Pectinatus haikarae]|uniref:Uncharacterized protein n=1 Tax=Pectinatus haikarae TaxID=349096 RepID=A0ABT9Y5W8_9FIRM|nr:hypothetical protein [Pectinatus haikarae]